MQASWCVSPLGAPFAFADHRARSERIQHYGQLWDEQAEKKLKEEEALKLIEPLLKRVKKEYADAEVWLKDWYAKQGITGPLPPE